MGSALGRTTLGWGRTTPPPTWIAWMVNLDSRDASRDSRDSRESRDRQPVQPGQPVKPYPSPRTEHSRGDFGLPCTTLIKSINMNNLESEAISIPKWDDPEHIQSLMRNRNVIRAVATYLQCTQVDLIEALRLRTVTGEEIEIIYGDDKQPVIRTFNNGYNSFSIPKPDTFKQRQIDDPAPVLKEVQRRLLSKLRQVPYSIAVTGGEPGSGVKENVKPHIPNKFMITMDIKDAFPSCTGERVSSNLEGYLNKQLNLSFPELSEEEREKFKDSIICLLVKDDKLPQGAPTSTHLLNIVLASVDREILKFIHTGEPSLHLPKYTRYLDDITISFRAFTESLAPWKIMRKVSSQAMQILEGITTDRSDSLEKMFESVENLLDEKIVINDNSEYVLFRKKLFEIRELLLRIKSEPYILENEEFLSKLYELIGKIDLLPKEFELKRDSVENIQKKIRSILVQKGWKEKISKTKFWTPNSFTVREVTGVTIGNDGRLGIPNKKMEEYIKLAQDCAYNPEALSVTYKTKGEVNPKKIAETLQGVRAYIQDIKGEIPQRFLKPYTEARNRHFQGWRESKAKYPIRLAGGY